MLVDLAGECWSEHERIGASYWLISIFGIDFVLWFCSVFFLDLFS